MSDVRAKFVVESKGQPDDTIGSVALRPVYSTDPTHENKKFWDATPSGNISMWIQNPAAYAKFNVGDEYYVDFTLAPKDVDITECVHCGQYHVKLVRHGDTVTCPTTGKPIQINNGEGGEANE